MPANVETMFYTRVEPWHGLGTKVMEAPTSKDALVLAGLDWKVEQQEIYTKDGLLLPGFQANIRDRDQALLGIVSDRYQVLQNEDAFQFTDALLEEGVTYETAGSLQGGKKTWMLAKMPEKYTIADDEITPYLVVMNSHDGSLGVKVAMTPIRVVCQNTLNLALRDAQRVWSAKHTENIMNRVSDAHNTIFMATKYMRSLGRDIEKLSQILLSDREVLDFISDFFPITEEMSDLQKKRSKNLSDELKLRYFEAPDLSHVGKNAWRFINAVSDFSTHTEPVRKTKNYKENLFLRTVEGNPMIDKAYKMVLSAA